MCRFNLYDVFWSYCAVPSWCQNAVLPRYKMVYDSIMHWRTCKVHCALKPLKSWHWTFWVHGPLQQSSAVSQLSQWPIAGLDQKCRYSCLGNSGISWRLITIIKWILHGGGLKYSVEIRDGKYLDYHIETALENSITLSLVVIMSYPAS